MPLAHKFGEREHGLVKQLHDCGIVYYPKHPYQLCVMSRGSDLGMLESSIADVSRVVYSAVDKPRRSPR